MPPSRDKEWKSVPGSGRLYRWSETRNSYIFEDGSVAPETNATRANLPTSHQPGSTNRVTGEQSARSAPMEPDDPELSADRWRAVRNQGERPSIGEPDIRGFRVRKNPEEDFRFGQVIETPVALPSEPHGSGKSDVTALPPNYSNQVEIQRFVVISPPTGTVSDGFKAVQLSSYGGLGVAAEGTIKHHHVIIYTSRSPPETTKEELPRRLRGGGSEGPMLTRPIQVKPKPGWALNSMARLNLGVIHHFELDVLARKFGNVVDDDFEDLKIQFLHIWRNTQRYASYRHTAAQSVANLEALSGTRINNPNNDAALSHMRRAGAQPSSRPGPVLPTADLSSYGSAPSTQDIGQYFMPAQGVDRARTEENTSSSTADFARRMEQMRLSPTQQSSAAVPRLTQEQQRQPPSNTTSRQSRTTAQGQDLTEISRISMVSSAPPTRGANREPRSSAGQPQPPSQPRRPLNTSTAQNDVYDSLAGFFQRLNQRRQIANERRLPFPAPLTREQQQALVNDATLQQQYLRNIDVQWESILNRRREHAEYGGTAADNDESDDDSDDDDSNDDDSVVEERRREGRRK